MMDDELSLESSVVRRYGRTRAWNIFREMARVDSRTYSLENKTGSMQGGVVSSFILSRDLLLSRLHGWLAGCSRLLSTRGTKTRSRSV
jgi:hypothetical protein